MTMKNNIKWLKVRKCSSSGPRRWSYILIPQIPKEEIDKWVKDYIKELDEDYSCRHEYQVINTKSVPNRMLKQYLVDLENHKIYLEEKSDETNSKIEKLKAIQEKGSKTDPDEIAYEKRAKKIKKLLKNKK
jgi:hypothetical protein